MSMKINTFNFWSCTFAHVIHLKGLAHSVPSSLSLPNSITAVKPQYIFVSWSKLYHQPQTSNKDSRTLLLKNLDEYCSHLAAKRCT